MQLYDDQLDTTIKKTQRKVETLKAQFHEHKKKWEHVSITVIKLLWLCIAWLVLVDIESQAH